MVGRHRPDAEVLDYCYSSGVATRPSATQSLAMDEHIGQFATV